MISYELKLNTQRWLLFSVVVLMSIFALTDLAILPDALHDEYWSQRYVPQVSSMLALLLYSYTPSYIKHKHFSYFIVLIFMSLSNIWFIKQCWLLDKAIFPYEGLLLYSLFAFFVLRLNFKLSLIYVLIASIAFGMLLLAYPIYGKFNQLYFSFFCAVNLICLVGLYTTEYQFKRAERLTNKLDELSQTDQLSGLLNRRAYEKKADRVFMSEESDEPIALYIVDIDDFKKFNDQFGHLDGDIIIKEQATILKSIFKRDSDVVGRYGGEEFIVIAPNTPLNEAERMAGLINELWQQYNIKNSQFTDVSCSIGLVGVANGSMNYDLKSLIAEADKALYLAKSHGKNCFESVDYPASVTLPKKES